MTYRRQRDKKITVTHYLNTNLKGYKINGVEHYAIYMQVSMTRKNTRIKSKYFDELYSVSNWEEMQKEHESINLFETEEETIKNILEAMYNTFREFDTLLFSLIINNSERTLAEIGKCDFLNGLRPYDIIKNEKSGELFSYFLIEYSCEYGKEMTVYEWFEDNTQDWFSEEWETWKKQEIKYLNALIIILLVSSSAKNISKKHAPLKNRYVQVFSNTSNEIDALYEAMGIKIS